MIKVSGNIIQRGNFRHQFSADDFVNLESIESPSAYWGGRTQGATVITNAGFVLAIVIDDYYAYCEQDALDEAANRGKLDGLQVTETELADFEVGKDSEGYPEYEGIINLGNAGEPFASESLDCFRMSAGLFADFPAVADVLNRKAKEDMGR